MGRKRKAEGDTELDLEEVIPTTLAGNSSEVLTQEGGEGEAEAPERFSPKWHDYVMSQFEPDELFEGNPTVDGLRRVVQSLIGQIFHSSSKVTSSPVPPDNRAVVEHTIMVEDVSTGVNLVYTAAADVYGGNCDGVYATYPVAVASTRAEGIALRKLLCLKRVMAAEEATVVSSEVDTSTEGMLIETNQINAIDVLSKRAGVNVMKFINQTDKKFASIKEVPYETARNMVGCLNKYINGAASVPEVIKGYDTNWRTQ